ncbi:hypothetical protein AURDEDRAFT_172829 [Auricularia subglabra TFB-10046 SS5]|uniref:Uncharacterized protein n=1 Tax=Auricularia subglabra (strain TFB-10046 / SS5) TaxID=717982 RepID=J0DBL5_AURST|nr:hypothetical protein AURDEDRAFT_172829 [Auricularia subglabra TFB-10046 SS5]
MREASPYNDAPTQPEAQAPMAPIFDLRTPEPPIAISDDGSHGTATPRAASPAPSVHPDTRIVAAGFPEDASQPTTEAIAGPSTLPAAPANSEYAGSVTADFEQLDLGLADQLLNESSITRAH